MPVPGVDIATKKILSTSDAFPCITCCDGETDCSKCPGGDPSSINVEFSGVDLCNCVRLHENGFGPPGGLGNLSSFWGGIAGDLASVLDGEHELEKVSSCVWRKIFLVEDIIVETWLDAPEAEESSDDCTQRAGPFVFPCNYIPCVDTVNAIQITAIRGGTTQERVAISVVLSASGEIWSQYNAFKAYMDFTSEDPVCINGDAIMQLPTCSVPAIPAATEYTLFTVDWLKVWDDGACGGESWAIGPGYVIGSRVDHTLCYYCILDHEGSSDKEPGVGANWETYWSEIV